MPLPTSPPVEQKQIPASPGQKPVDSQNQKQTSETKDKTDNKKAVSPKKRRGGSANIVIVKQIPENLNNIANIHTYFKKYL
jgi:hypothetical protein